ncbi:AAC(3) family N-acetyltransferase [Micromonospora orduensis]|uniref:Aminoglycoside N(3)-acetyltransferase n=1 Tax=Micromonospora orduensis TaxID=1420891 RepID=A0A5C4QY81_9ACTN|nr:AAC(3) family N-acetyltransferase [Micromonospora orduensis]TNH30995.1 AAC(3) family N-acetyltransferase [Micromonospora orduensis]
MTDPAALPFDVGTLAAHLRASGVAAGQDVLVHSSLRRVGPLAKGAETLVEALSAVLGPDGTLVVPTHNAGNSTTSRTWHEATRGMSAHERLRYEASLPGWDRERTAAQGVGAFAEYVRLLPGAVRSDHPQTSFAAVGRRAAFLTADHALGSHLGSRSPIGRMYDTGGHVLLLGVGYDACSALHLAEYRLSNVPVQAYRCYRQAGERRLRCDFVAPELDDSDFDALGASLDDEPFVRPGVVGQAATRLFPIRPTVDFAVKWFVGNRISPRH